MRCSYTLIESWTHAVQKAGTVQSDKVLSVMNSYQNEPFTAGPTTFSKDLHIQVNRPWLIMKVENRSFHAAEMFRNTIVPDKKLLFRVGQ